MTLLSQTALKPPIFRKLYDNCFLNAPEALIIEYLMKEGFTRTGAFNCAKSFKETFDFVREQNEYHY